MSSKECLYFLQEAGFHLELEFVQCELMVKSLQDKQETYQKNVVDVSFEIHVDSNLNALYVIF